MKDVIREILQREEINRIFKFFSSLTENSLTIQIFANDSIYLEGHVMTPGFLGFISGASRNCDTETDMVDES